MAIDNIREGSYSCAIAVWCVCESIGIHLENIGGGECKRGESWLLCLANANSRRREMVL